MIQGNAVACAQGIYIYFFPANNLNCIDVQFCVGAPSLEATGYGSFTFTGGLPMITAPNTWWTA